MTFRSQTFALFAGVAIAASAACSSTSDPRKVIIGDSSGGSANTAGSGVSPGVGGGLMLGGMGGGAGTTGDGGSGLVMNGVCDQQPFDLVRKPPQILLLLDRSGSMTDEINGTEKWAYVVPGVSAAVTATNNDVEWGLKLFPESMGNECQASSVNPGAPVGIAPMNAMAVVAGIPATPTGDGTPTATAINSAVAYMQGLGTDNPKYILLATDGEPSCAVDFASNGDPQGDAVKAAAAAVQAGIKVFVVGVLDAKDSAQQSLNDVAVAGGQAAADHNPFAKKFLLAGDQADLVSAIESITSTVATCVFPLSTKPPDPTNIAVVIDKQEAPKDINHVAGWDYTGPDQMTVQVYGSYCDQIKQSANQVLIILGCMGKPIMLPK
jgi:hypothetical protein